MKLPFTKKTLKDWAGYQVLKDAESLIKHDQVFSAEYNHPSVSGIILWNNRKLNTSFKILPDGNIESHCPCYNNKERGLICIHIISLALTLIQRSTDPLRDTKYKEELRRAKRINAFDESSYIKRVPPDTPGAIPASIVLTLNDNWLNTCKTGEIDLSCLAEYDGKMTLLDEVPEDLPLTLSKEDESILFVIEDISEGPAKGKLSLNLTDFCNLLRLYSGKQIACSNGETITVNDARLSTYVHMDLDRENGELILIAHTEMPYLSPGTFPEYIIAGKTGFAYGNGNFWPLENILPTPYHSIYRAPVIIPRQDVLRFISKELSILAKHARIESNIPAELFTVEQATPRFHIVIKGSPASLSGTLHALYDNIKLIACKADARENFGIPDPNDILRYTTRNHDAEKAAMIRLQPSGLSGEYGDRLSSIVGKRDVLNFLATWIPALRRKGWRIDLQGRIEPHMESLQFATPVVHVHESSDEKWFDIGFEFEDDHGATISPADVQSAIIKGDSYIQKGNKTILIDSDAIESMQNVFSDCASDDGAKAGQFRMSSVYTPFVKSSLDAIDGIDIEANKEWRETAIKYNRSAKLKPIALGQPLDGILRNYQKDGVNWLSFLESQGFCGILADEMGLGKTIQTLAWLDYNRRTAKSPQPPVLVVCPTSLVENWADETQKFAPDMKVITLTGTKRQDKWKDIKNYDMGIISYAIMRRDLDSCLEHEFSVVILDEAQHIKNKSTQNAVAAKQIKAHHRLVLTGTPVENSVSDLWSIMDFLMPGYLGNHSTFRQNYHLPISRGGQEGEMAQAKLRRKLHPFLMRRMKAHVAKDLPAKMEKISSCALSSDQRVVYKELLDASRRKINNMVKQKGFNKCRMEILTTLLRLRQISCHLDLLKLPDLKAEHPSSKMELLFELLDEAIDGGHRVLIFSQFVSMLKILRKEMDSKKMKYCYLDGSTKDRLSIVKQFNTERNIPVFLISLKAGGTGLNLTGADMV
ncbi:MAG: DEAD/DEAH box helicase family protein, partial [Kiritimatiellae bacterium]|nr:DEAD/DEAH box helicase family protein [Kiritimatiellia bacterium]